VRREKRSVAVLLFLIFAGIPLYPVDVENAPGWLIFEKGKQLFDAGEYGDAVYYFRKAREVLGSAPEVEYWIGLVFEAEGEYNLAAKQYEAALRQRNLLLVPDEEIEFRSRLADVYFTVGDFAAYSEQLETIIRYDAGTRRKHTNLEIEPRTLTRTLTEQGFDKLLELYRIDDYGALSAYYGIGVYKYRTGFLESAIEYLAYAVVVTHTSLVKYLIDRDPEYRFSTLPELLSEALRHRRLQEYMYAVDAFGQLYALGTALYATGEPTKREIAAGLWRLVAEYDENGWWSGKARRQLAAPFADDFMILLPR